MTDVWKARLLPASFRGIPFFVESHELKGGRHAVKHDTPDRNITTAEDIGRRGKNFMIEAHIMGDGYFLLRDALEKAMDEPGAGTLVHPYKGVKEVQPEGYTLKESATDGRMAIFSLEFSEAGDQSFPFTALDKVTDFITAVAGLTAQVKNAFQVLFKLSSLPTSFQAEVEAMVVSFAEDLKASLKNARLNADQQAALEKKLDDISGNASALIANPASLVEELDTAIGGLEDIVQDTVVDDTENAPTIDDGSGRDDKLTIFDPVLEYRGGSDDIPETTPTRKIQKETAQALANAINQLGIAHLSRQVIAKDFKSIEDAISGRERVTDAIAGQLVRDNIDDSVVQGLMDINAKIVESVPNPDSSFANTQNIELLSATPSLVLSYDLYGSVGNELDIIKRNKVRHPGFISGNLKVLSA